jgi:hypothetical protein
MALRATEGDQDAWITAWIGGSLRISRITLLSERLLL